MHYIKSSTLKLSPRASRICPLVVMIFIISLMSRLLACYRNSRLEVFYKKVFLKILGNSQENASATLLTKRLWHRCFLVNFQKFLRTPFLTEHLLLAASDVTKQCFMVWVKIVLTSSFPVWVQFFYGLIGDQDFNWSFQNLLNLVGYYQKVFLLSNVRS